MDNLLKFLGVFSHNIQIQLFMLQCLLKLKVTSQPSFSLELKTQIGKTN